MQKKSQVTASLKEQRDLLVRLLMIAQERELDLKEVMKYPLSSMPYALATFDGSMVKTTKAALLHEVEKSSQDQLGYRHADFNANKVVIVDAMVLIQQQSQFPETFGEFASSILRQLISISRKYKAKRVDFVADRYKDMSIKDAERQKRAVQGETKFRINRSDQKMPKLMKKFLASGNNKEGLLTFLVDEWKSTSPQYFCDVTLYATKGDTCVKFSKGTDGNLLVENAPELQSDHEEADTRMLLHVFQASQSTPAPLDIILCTVDTDVFVIALWMSTVVTARLILFLMTGNRSRQLDLQAMSSTMKEQTTEALVGLHPFTGCDSVSAFKGKGKIKALKLMLNSPQYITTFCELGKSWELRPNLRKDLEKFVCDLYGWKDETDINTVRYNCYRVGTVTDLTLPPNCDSLSLHMERANYQAKIFRSCQQQYINPPDPSAHGWKVNASKLEILWNTLPIAP
ncbi:hypothetical protein SNE40_021951 [Patella caerulea]|uniref:Uncharacterized protein n=1 Tax=Patella caerulea TaxID=87958 RepID=A0AAN8IYG2_PATCE